MSEQKPKAKPERKPVLFMDVVPINTSPWCQLLVRIRAGLNLVGGKFGRN